MSTWLRGCHWTASFSEGEGEHLPELPGKLISCFLPLREGELLPACLPEWPEMPLSCFLPQREGEHLPDLPGKMIDCFLFLREGGCLPEMLLNCFLP